MASIGNYLGKYVDIVEPKGGIFFYDRICIEVDLEKGHLEVINLKLDNWNHKQILDYEKIPFKCN